MVHPALLPVKLLHGPHSLANDMGVVMPACQFQTKFRLMQTEQKCVPDITLADFT